MRAPTIARTLPYNVKVEDGQSHVWCACGRSQNQPFCDSSHLGSDWTPKYFEAKRTGTVFLCGCKHTKTPPFCDGSHQNFDHKA